MKQSIVLNRTIAVFFLSISALISHSCIKSSNELKPFSQTETFDKNIEFNGSTILIVEVSQKIEVGPDSLTIKVQNPNNQVIDSMELFVYFTDSDKFDETLDFRTSIWIENLAANADTIFTILSHPELPVTEDDIQIVLINRFNNSDNILSGVYDGLAKYLKTNETSPSSFSFAKGLIAADGNFQFWMKLNEIEKSFSGQFIDTTAINAMYLASEGSNPVGCTLENIGNDTNIILTSNSLEFNIKLMGQLPDDEERIWFTLNK